MKPTAALAAVALILAATGTAGAVTLVFDANDIFDYATSDGSRLQQQGTARYLMTSAFMPEGRYYQTYNEGTRHLGSTAEEDLLTVANVLTFQATAGYQGVSHVQLWLSDSANAPKWGEKVVQVGNQAGLTASAGGEVAWTAEVNEHPWDADGDDPPYEPGTDQYGIVHYNTVLGGTPAEQNAISPDFNPADALWSVTGDFYVDENANGQYDSAVDSDLVIGQDYTLWFSAWTNNWYVEDDYGNGEWGSFEIQGTLKATAVPEPVTMAGLVMGIGALGGYIRRRRRT